MKTKKSNTELLEPLEPQTFLDISGMARKVAEFRKDEQIYSQGDAAKSVMYIQKGNVKFSVLSASGKVAVVAMLMEKRSTSRTTNRQLFPKRLCRK